MRDNLAKLQWHCPPGLGQDFAILCVQGGGGHRWQGLSTNPQAKLGDLLVDIISLVEGDISGLRLMS